jgi:hypothetical protein
VRRNRLEAGFQSVAQRQHVRGLGGNQHVRGLGGKMALRRRGCRPEGCDTDEIFGAGAQAALVAAAADQRLRKWISSFGG